MKNSILLFLFLTLIQSTNIFAQSTTVDFKYKVVTSPSNQIHLRWMPDNPSTWNLINNKSYKGLRLVRMRYSSNSSVTAEETIIINVSTAFDKPTPLSDLITSSSQTTLKENYYRLLYNSSLDTTSATSSGLDTQTASLEERHFMASMAADMNFQAATQFGLGHIDVSNILSKKFYRYAIEVYNTSLSTVDKWERIFTSDYISVTTTSYPSPRGLKFIKSSVPTGRIMLKWGVVDNESDETERKIYAGYYIERAVRTMSDNSSPIYLKLGTPDSQGNVTPYINLTELNANYFTDSVANNTLKYSYRVRGISFFGDEIVSLPKDTTVYKLLESKARIQKVFKNISDFTLTWVFPEKGNPTAEELATVNGYLLQVSSTSNGFGSNSFISNSGSSVISKTVNQIKIANTTLSSKGINIKSPHYYRILTLGISNDTLYAEPYLFIPIDSIAPSKPSGFRVSSSNDSNNEYKLSLAWDRNPIDEDVVGYQVHRIMTGENEKIYVGDGIRDVTEIQDYFSTSMDFPNATYYLIAYDANYNPSQPAVLNFQKPDTHRPTPPIIREHMLLGSNSVKLFFNQSPEKYFGKSIEHNIYRKELDTPICDFQLVKHIDQSSDDSSWIDTGVIAGKSYVYTLVATDSGGNISCFNTPNKETFLNSSVNSTDECNCHQTYIVQIPNNGLRAPINPFIAEVSTNRAAITIKWSTSSSTEIREFELMKGVYDMYTKPSLIEVIPSSLYNTYSYEDLDVSFGKKYKYLIRAVYKDKGLSEWAELTTTTLVEPVLTISKSDIYSPSVGGNYTIALSSNLPWTLSGLPSWCTLSPQSSDIDALLSLTVSPNNGVSRDTTIIFDNGGKSVSLNVAQANKPIGTGLLANYYNAITNTISQDSVLIADLPPDVQRIDSTVDFIFPQPPAIGLSINYLVKWTGYIEVPVDGDYYFSANADDGIRLKIGNDVIFNMNTGDLQQTVNSSRPITLKAGKKYTIEVLGWSIGGLGGFKLYWSYNGLPKEIIPQQYLYPLSIPDSKNTDFLHNKCFTIKNNDLNKYLEYGQNFMTNFAEFKGTREQIWKLEKLETNLYKIISQIDPQGKVLEAFIPYNAEGLALFASTGFFSNKTNQIWDITPTSTDGFNIKLKSSEFSLNFTNVDENGLTIKRGIVFKGDPRIFKLNTIGCPTNSSDLTVNKSSISVGAEGGIEDLIIDTEGYWSSISNQTWAATSPYNDFGRKTITISVAPIGMNNADPSMVRYALINTKNDKNTIITTIKQYPEPKGFGLTGNYYSSTNFNNIEVKNPNIVRLDDLVDFNWSPITVPDGFNMDFAVRWEGFIEPPASGNYTFYCNSDDGARLWINNTKLIEDNSVHTETELVANKPIYLNAGEKYPVKLEYWNTNNVGAIRLKWLNDKTLSKRLVEKKYLFPSEGYNLTCKSVAAIMRNSLLKIDTNDKACVEINLEEGFETTIDKIYTAEIEQ